jgi:ribosomal protein S4E
MEKVIEFKSGRIVLNAKEGCTILYLNENYVIELEDCIEQQKILKDNMPDGGHLLLIIPGKHSTITSEAREYSTNNPMNNKAVAIVSNSLAQKIIVNFMISVYQKIKPGYKIKLFSNKDKALEWLQKQK